MLQSAYFLAKIGADTAEIEQYFAEIEQHFAETAERRPPDVARHARLRLEGARRPRGDLRRRTPWPSLHIKILADPKHQPTNKYGSWTQQIHVVSS